MIKTQQLLHARALIKHGTFGKAAQTQNISRPAFSRSIANLEKYLGVKLFHRHTTGVSVTVYGEIIEKYIRHGELVEGIIPMNYRNIEDNIK